MTYVQVRSMVYQLDVEGDYAVFELVSMGHPTWRYEKINFPVRGESELEEVEKLFATNAMEVIQFDILARKMASSGIPYLEEVLQVPVSDRYKKLIEIFYID